MIIIMLQLWRRWSLRSSPDRTQSRPPAGSAVWRTAAGPPPPPACCLSVCHLAWCIQAGARTHTGGSLRLDTTLQHTGGKGKRARDGEGALSNSEGDWRRSTEKEKEKSRAWVKEKRSPDYNKLWRVMITRIKDLYRGSFTINYMSPLHGCILKHGCRDADEVVGWWK